MCRHFLLIPHNIVNEIIKEIMVGRKMSLTCNQSISPSSVFPKMEAPIITKEDSNLISKMMIWGYERSWSSGPLFNTRIETAVKPGTNMWTDSFHKRRCIVPTYGFFESHRTEKWLNPRSKKENKQQYFFTSPSSPVLFLAGIYEANRFSIMTTAPNSSVSPVHDRMPLVLHENELTIWLNGEYERLIDRSHIDLNAEESFHLTLADR